MDKQINTRSIALGKRPDWSCQRDVRINIEKISYCKRSSWSRNRVGSSRNISCPCISCLSSSRIVSGSLTSRGWDSEGRSSFPYCTASTKRLLLLIYYWVGYY
jgi:hypothetical protein